MDYRLIFNKDMGGHTAYVPLNTHCYDWSLRQHEHEKKILTLTMQYFSFTKVTFVKIHNMIFLSDTFLVSKINVALPSSN